MFLNLKYLFCQTFKHEKKKFHAYFSSTCCSKITFNSNILFVKLGTEKSYNHRLLLALQLTEIETILDALKPKK